MAHERTPLITTVAVKASKPRYSRHVTRRFFTIALSSTLIFVFVVTIFNVLFEPAPAPRGVCWSWRDAQERERCYKRLTSILTETPSSEKAEEWQRYYTAGAHMAGQNYSQVEWTKAKWEEFGVKSEIVAYETYLNRPVDHRLALLKKQKGKHAKDASAWEVSYEASLTEDMIDEDPTTGLDNSIPTFHGYSASGNVTASIVYVNYGTFQDFEDLVKANVSLEGNIAIARYGGIFRGLKVKRAQELGMVGVILYSDPGEDGDKTEGNGYDYYPNGPARQPSSVQRGSTQFLSVGPGDPTTPGYPSKPGVPRGPTDRYIPSIPSLPISYADALPILKALNGHGPKAADFNEYWTRNAGLAYKGVQYNIGPTPADVVVNLRSEQEYLTTPIWNVIGIINGTIPDEVVVIGNHRDAWIVGGAGDPNSGSAVLNEAIRSFGAALRDGWKPLRTIVFASWDGEEYGLIGSTEWVEEYLPWLKSNSVAYVNVDVGVNGQHFEASGAPLLDQLLYDVTAAVQSPNQTVKGQSVRDTWAGHISTIGSGSDFTAFQDYAGVPSVTVEFGTGPESPVYHYHSNYDSFHWMAKYGDPGFIYHRTMAQVIGLLGAKLAEQPVLSFRAANYAKALFKYVDQVESKLEAAIAGHVSVDIATLSEKEIAVFRASHRSTQVAAARSGDGVKAETFKKSLQRLRRVIGKLEHAAARLDERADKLARHAAERDFPWWKLPAKWHLASAIRDVNTKYKYLERKFLFDKGLDGRSWFKHVVYAPGLWTGYAGAVFPGLVESIDSADWGNAIRWSGIIEDRIVDAAQSL